MNTKELAAEVAFAYQKEMENARRAVLKSTFGILPPRESREGLEYFTSQWCRRRDYLDVLRNDGAFDTLVDTALRMVRGFVDTPRSSDDPIESDEELKERRRAREMCEEIGVPYRDDFKSEADVVRHLLSDHGYHKWLSYASLTAPGRLGNDLPREKARIKSYLEGRLNELNDEVEADA